MPKQLGDVQLSQIGREIDSWRWRQPRGQRSLKHLAETIAKVGGVRVSAKAIYFWRTGQIRPNQEHQSGLAKVLSKSVKEIEDICTEESVHRSANITPAAQQEVPHGLADSSSLGESFATNRILPERAATSDGLDYLPHRWVTTNHSKFMLEWANVPQKESAEIANVIRSNYGKTAIQVISPAHVESSQVYGVIVAELDKPDVFIKVLRENRSEEQLNRLLAIHRAISSSTILPNGFTKLLWPLISLNTGSPWVQMPNDNLAIAFPFVEGVTDGRVTHFKGASRSELVDIGRRLGQLNDVLSKSGLPPMKEPSEFARNEKLWSQVVGNADSIKDDALLDRRSYIFLAEIQFIKELYHRVRALSRDAPKIFPMTLHDFHPHNALVANDTCVVVVDLEGARQDWPEEGTVLFAMHRFCRERVRRIFRANTRLDEVELVKDAVSAFLEGYRETRDISVTSEGILWAKAINFAKLIDNFAYRHFLEDTGKRAEEQHYNEVIKFVSYLKEFEILQKALFPRT